MRYGTFGNVAGALGGMLGQTGAPDANAMPALLSAILAKSNLGDLDGMVANLQQGGLGKHAGEPPAAPRCARHQQVQQLSDRSACRSIAAPKLLSEHLPANGRSGEPERLAVPVEL